MTLSCVRRSPRQTGSVVANVGRDMFEVNGDKMCQWIAGKATTLPISNGYRCEIPRLVLAVFGLTGTDKRDFRMTPMREVTVQSV